MFLLFLIQLLGAAHASGTKAAFSYTDTVAFDECGDVDGNKPDFDGHCDKQKWVSAFPQPMLIKASSADDKNYLMTSVSFDSSIVSVTTYNTTEEVPDKSHDYEASGDIGMVEARVIVTDENGRLITTVPESVIMLRDVTESFIGLENFQCMVDPDTNNTLDCDEVNEDMQEITVATTFNFFAWPLTGGVATIDVQYRLTANADASSYGSSAIAITGTSKMAATTIIETLES